MTLRVTVLGCGGSLGVPMVGNNWGTCDPANPKNRRRRPAILVEGPGEEGDGSGDGTTLLIDTPTDLRAQLIDAGATRLDAVLYTHDHADHVHGMDDLRPMIWGRGPLPAYADAATLDTLCRRFGYAVGNVEIDRGLYKPILQVTPIDGPFRAGGLDIVPIVQDHGYSESLGFRFGDFAYSTDVVTLSETAMEALAGIRVWIVDATREDPHPTHAHLDRALGWIERLKPERAYLTHMNHTMDYDRLMATLPPGVEPAYDGLVIEM
ncbi:MAG: MBL fold metallo-hydrolase [Inquilinus sp.]|nr:MBL fold metallo-hydrolase [Inquilinus sp.]